MVETSFKALVMLGEVRWVRNATARPTKRGLSRILGILFGVWKKAECDSRLSKDFVEDVATNSAFMKERSRWWNGK